MSDGAVMAVLRNILLPGFLFSLILSCGAVRPPVTAVEYIAAPDQEDWKSYLTSNLISESQEKKKMISVLIETTNILTGRFSQSGISVLDCRILSNDTIAVTVRYNGLDELLDGIILKQGRLEMRLVDENTMSMIDEPEKDAQGRLALRRGMTPEQKLPEGSAWYPVQNENENPPGAAWLALLNPSGITETNVTKSEAGRTPYGYVIDFDLDSEGTSLLADLTKRNINKRVAVVLDDSVISAPFIQAPIKDGRCQIAGNLTKNEAGLIASILRTRRLPVKLAIIRKSIISFH